MKDKLDDSLIEDAIASDATEQKENNLLFLPDQLRALALVKRIFKSQSENDRRAVSDAWRVQTSGRSEANLSDGQRKLKE